MLFNEIDILKEELRELFRERYTKSELIQAVAARLNNFQQLRGTSFQAAINEFVVLRAEDDCEILIHDEEIGGIWKNYELGFGYSTKYVDIKVEQENT